MKQNRAPKQTVKKMQQSKSSAAVKTGNKQKIKKPGTVSHSVGTKRKRRRRKGKNVLYYCMFAFIAVAVSIILSLTVFFKIEKLEVEGCDKYQASAIISTSGIRTGDNTFRIEDKRVKEILMTQFPYIEDVKIRRSLPATMTLQVTQAVPLGAFLNESGYVLVSTTGRVLEVGKGKCPPEHFQVSGVEVGLVVPGQYINESRGEEFVMLKYLTDAVYATGFDKITEVDLSNRLNITLFYDDRLRIELGVEDQLDDKLDFAYYAIQNNLRPDFEGVMDVTVPKQVRTMPGEIHPEGYHEGKEIPLLGAEDGEETDGDTTDNAADTEGSSSQSTSSQSPASSSSSQSSSSGAGSSSVAQ